MATQDIKDLSLSELQDYLIRINEKPFRAQQIFEGIYQKGAENFSAMTTLPSGLRQRLGRDFEFASLKLLTEAVSSDGTRKFLFALSDGEKIESVLIPAKGRATVCVSTQAGCKFGCLFCASGVAGWRRDLISSEILAQVLFARRQAKAQPVTHVVFMGTGEPLDNYEKVLKSIRVLNSPSGMNIAARRITISTCGLIPQIQKFAKEKLQVELSVSLHGFNDISRAKVMPVAKQYSFSDLMKACREYANATKRQVTFEYILIDGLTATPEAPKVLARSLRGMLCKVNLIPYNPVHEFDYFPPSKKEILAFKSELSRQGIPVTIRTPRGEDIAAACGQLRHAWNKK